MSQLFWLCRGEIMARFSYVFILIARGSGHPLHKFMRSLVPAACASLSACRMLGVLLVRYMAIAAIKSPRSDRGKPRPAWIISRPGNYRHRSDPQPAQRRMEKHSTFRAPSRA